MNIQEALGEVAVGNDVRRKALPNEKLLEKVDELREVLKDEYM